MFGFIGTLIAWLQYIVGLRTDTDNPAGSLHSKVLSVYNKMTQRVTSSSNQKYAADTEETTNSSTYVKLKEIILYVNGSISVYHEAKVGTGLAYSRIYINGIAVGVENSVGTSYAAFTETIYVKAGDAVQIYAHGGGSYTVYVRNFRIMYDVQTANGIVIIN